MPINANRTLFLSLDLENFDGSVALVTGSDIHCEIGYIYIVKTAGCNNIQRGDYLN
jgi:hypothetical protein